MKSIGVITIFFCLIFYSCSSTKPLLNTLSIADGTVEGTLKMELNLLEVFRLLPLL